LKTASTRVFVISG